MPAIDVNHSDEVPSELGDRVVQRALLISAIAAPAASLVVFLQALAPDSLNTRTILMCAFGSSFIPLWLVARNLNYKIAGTAIICMLLATLFTVQLFSGLYTTQAPMQLITIIQAGFSILQAKDGDAALRIIDSDSESFDLLSIDGVIPGASTADVIQYLHAKNPQARVVVCSGFIEEELLLRGIRTGDLTYVRKPYLIDELLDCTRSQLAIIET